MEQLNTYNVTLVFDTCSITTTLMALSEDAAAEMASGYVAAELNIHEACLDVAQDVLVEIVDRNVGMCV